MHRDLSTTRLAQLIHKKRQVLEQLLELGRRQAALIDDGELATLLKLLGIKQQFLSGLQAVERELAPFHDQDPDGRSWPGTAERSRCAEEAAHCNELLKAVLELERTHELQMVNRRAEVATQLREAHTATQAAGAYQAQRGTFSSSHRFPAASISYESPSPAAIRLDLASEA